MSQAPHYTHVRSGVKMGNSSLVDTMIADGLTDAFHNIHMGETGQMSSFFSITIIVFISKL